MAARVNWSKLVAERGCASLDEMLADLMLELGKPAYVARELGVSQAAMNAKLRELGWHSVGERRATVWVAPGCEAPELPARPEREMDADVAERLNPLAQRVLVVDFARNTMCEGRLLAGMERPLPKTAQEYEALAEGYALVLMREVL